MSGPRHLFIDLIKSEMVLCVHSGDTGEALGAAQAKSPGQKSPAASVSAAPGVPAHASQGIDQGIHTYLNMHAYHHHL